MKEMAEASKRSVAEQFKALQERHIIGIAERHLKISSKIEDHVEKVLRKPKIGVNSLNQLSKTLSNVADVSHGIVGIKALENKDPGKPMLVQFNLSVTPSVNSIQPLKVVQSEPVHEAQLLEDVLVPF